MNNFTLKNGNALTFFHGKTYDGHCWVLAFEGGNTRNGHGFATGLIPVIKNGRVSRRKVLLTIHTASELRSLLPSMDVDEVLATLHFLMNVKAAA